MKTQTGRTEGFWLSVPVYGQVDPIIVRLGHDQLGDSETWAEAIIDAEDAGRIAFIEAGYESMDECYATIYQIGPNGGLIHSECFPISGPEAI